MKNSVLRSRKFWAAVVGLFYAVLICFWPDFPFPEESINCAGATIVSYILGTAIEDGLRKQ